MTWMAVFFGGGLGAATRFALLRLVGVWSIETVWIILSINLIGSLVLGVVIGWVFAAERTFWDQPTKDLLHAGFVTGFLGGFTTYAAFSWDIVLLAQRHWGITAFYVVVSVVGGLLLILLGLKIGESV